MRSVKGAKLAFTTSMIFLKEEKAAWIVRTYWLVIDTILINLVKQSFHLSTTYGVCFCAKICNTELEFLKSLWGLGSEEEEGYRTGPPGYIGWRNSFLGIDSGAPHTFKNTGSECPWNGRWMLTNEMLGGREEHWSIRADREECWPMRKKGE